MKIDSIDPPSMNRSTQTFLLPVFSVIERHIW